jgi:hypothetical protein
VKKIFVLVLTLAFCATVAFSNVGCGGKTETKKETPPAGDKKDDKK